MAGAFAKNAELGSFGRFWTVLGGFGKCHPHYRVHIAGSLPLLRGPTRCNIPAPNSERGGFRTQNSVFQKVPFGPKWARMVPMAYAPISYVPIRVPLIKVFVWDPNT